MEVILAYVVSADGFLTDSRGRQAPEWASMEDQEHFQNLMPECGVSIIGSNTYEAHKHSFADESPIRRIVMTRKPEKFAGESVPGSIEFTSLSPRDVIRKLEDEGHKKVLFAGGPKLYAQFFKDKLIAELQITTEPLLFGSGLSAAGGIPSDIELMLIDIKRLNQRGTLLARYKVL